MVNWLVRSLEFKNQLMHRDWSTMEAESIDDEETTDRGGSINNGRSTDNGMMKGPIDGSLVSVKTINERYSNNYTWQSNDEY